MKGLHIFILSIFLSLSFTSNAVVHLPSTGAVYYETGKKKEKPRKKIKKWIRNHKGALIFGGITLTGVTMIILGVIWKTRWLWMTGLFISLAPWILAFIALILYLIFGRQRPMPIVPEEIPQEETKTKEKDTK